MYTWDYGDGTVLNTTDNRFTTHVYRRFGTYNITVTIANHISMQQVSQLIFIEDTLANLSVISSGTPLLNIPFPYFFLLSQGTNYTCHWNLGDGGIITVSNDETTPKSNSTYMVNFVRGGLFTVRVNCSNHISRVNTSLVQLAQFPITNLRLVSMGAEYNKPINISFAIDTGSDVTFELSFDGILYPTVYFPALYTGYTFPFLSAQDAGLHQVKLRAYNSISDVTITSDFVIESPVTNPFVSLDTNITTPGKNVAFLVGMQTGTSIQITWQFEDGINITYSMSRLSLWPTNDILIRYRSFNNPGVYTATTTVENSYNSFTFKQTILVCSILSNLTLNTNSPISYSFDTGANAIFWFTTKSKLPTAINVTFNYGDGSALETYPFELNKNYSHNYMKLGTSSIVATISDIVSSQTYSASILVVTQMSGLSAIQPSFAALGLPTNLSIYMVTGDNVTLSVDWGDGANDVWPRQGWSNYY